MRVRATASAVRAKRKDDGEEEDAGEDEYLDFSDGWFISGIAYIIGVVTVVANGYLPVTLILGNGT
jgi:metal iron transporter